MSRILIADDQPDVLEALRILLKGEGHQTDAVTSLGAVMNALDKRTYALLMMDLNYTRDTTSGQEGLEVIPRIQTIDETLPIVVMTAWATVDLAVEAMKLGARDFVTKPWDNDRLASIVRTQIALGNALRKSQQLEAKNELLRGKMPNIISDSPRMRPVIELIARVAPSDANVLITGENGTGKGLVAQALHSLSTRTSKIMITVNMGGLSEGVFESELFGHVKGAFTDAKTDRAGRFELADESTLFLDEIANLPMSQQAKLLRVIETGEFERVGSSRTLHANVRIISATNRDLPSMVAEGQFREDLYYRISVIPMEIPPLRHRRDDIPLLANHFMSRLNANMGKKIGRISAESLKKMESYSWPGNVRELENAIERAFILETSDELSGTHLPESVATNHKMRAAVEIPDEGFNLEHYVEQLQKNYLQEALRRSNGVQVKAAELLQMTYRSFRHYMQKYNVES